MIHKLVSPGLQENILFESKERHPLTFFFYVAVLDTEYLFY